MTHSITINFPSYEVMKDFVGSFDFVSQYFDGMTDVEGNELCNSNETWDMSHFSVEGTEVSEATTLELFHYFYSGSTGGFKAVKDKYGNNKLIRMGILNPRGQN